MKIIERIRETMIERNIKQIDLAKAVGFGKSTINAWFNNNSDPKAEQLPPIAKLLGVSLDYLITGKEATTAPRLTIDEEHLLKNYRLASDKGRGRIQECAREMVQLYPALPDDLEGILTVLDQKKIQKAGTIKPVADDNIVGYAIAGTGIRKPNTEVAKKADITHTEQ